MDQWIKVKNKLNYLVKLADPDAAKPIRDPDAAKPIRDPDAAKPIRDPDAVKPIRDPDAVKPIRDPDAAKPIRDPDAVKPIRDPGVTKAQTTSPTSSVKSMQTKMQEFAKIIIPSSGKTKEEGGRLVPGEAGLGYFLARSYSGSGKYEQFENPEATKIKEKGKLQKTDDYTSIRNSIENIGSATAEKRPDGIWGPKTQNGIRNILNLSGSLIEFADRIEFTANKDFDSSQKEKLSQLIPSEDNPSAKLPYKELNQRAEEICPILDKLNSFASALNQHLISSYKEYSEGGKFTGAEIPSAEAKELELDHFDQSYLDKIHPFNIDYQQQTFENITLNDLKSYESLKKKLKPQMEQKGVSIDQWMIKNYSNFIATAKTQIIKELETRGQILDESAVKEINNIRSNIMSCLELNSKISSDFDRDKYGRYIQTQLTDPIKKSPVYKSSDKRKELLEKSKLMKKQLEDKVKEQYKVEK